MIEIDPSKWLNPDQKFALAEQKLKNDVIFLMVSDLLKVENSVKHAEIMEFYNSKVTVLKEILKADREKGDESFMEKGMNLLKGTNNE